MIDKIERLETKIKEDIGTCKSLRQLHDFKVKYLGKKGEITKILRNIGSLSPNQRPKQGIAANKLKQRVSVWIERKNKELVQVKSARIKKEINLDITLPGKKPLLGHRHPINHIIEESCSIFSSLGFEIVFGPEIETDYYNFEALNIPPEHPSRDVFDTFYLKKKKEQKPEPKRWLLRSQTSTVQIRIMEKNFPPLKVVAPGKVYRPDTSDASHSFMFHQIEGLLVDRDVRFSQLKGTLLYFAKKLFYPDIKVRFRPHFFPFTEPSAEVDISCIICNGKGCSVCSHKGWLEILGAGMVDPNVFKAVGYDINKYTGFAFGMGVERIALLKYGIDDIRMFTDNDIRFLSQF